MVPRTLYGVTKRAMEQAGTWLSEECGRMLGQKPGATFDFRTIRYPGLLSADTLPTGGPVITPPRWCMPQSEVKKQVALFRVMLDSLS